jgi:hypothetical protein
MKSIGHISGVWAKPGVSKNRRLYTAEAIESAVNEAQSAIDAGEVLPMLTHHGARDPRHGSVLSTAGQLTGVTWDPTAKLARFEADLADTSTGRDVAALTITEDGSKPFLKSVSMAAAWKAKPVAQMTESGPVETSPAGLTLKGIDFTHFPGVGDAEVTSGVLAEAFGESDADVVIFEEADDEHVFVETVAQVDPKAVSEATGDPTPDGTDYADPGYQKDGKQRYPLNSTRRIRSAWAYINVSENAAKYTANQVKRIKGKIKKAAGKAGINIAEDLQLLGGEILEALEALPTAEIDEAYASMSLDNGPGSVSVSTYGQDPADLHKVTAIVAMAALAALYQLDPDMDGDLDLDRFDTGESDDDTMDDCPQCGQANPDGTQYCPACGTSLTESDAGPSGATETRRARMGEDKTKGGTGSANESELTDREKFLIAEATKATYESLGRNADGTEKPVEESDELKAARLLIAEADKTGTATTTTTTTVEEAAPFDPAKFAADLTVSITESLKADLIKEVRESAAGPRRHGRISREVLEQEPETVYGKDPGERGEELRTASTKDLNDLANKAFGDMIDA